MRDFFVKKNDRLPQVAIFMSGSGTNAEKILETHKNATVSERFWEPTVIVTDNPMGSRAKEIAKNYEIPLIEHDIKSFYHERGEKRVSLATERGRIIREEWTDELRKKLAPYRIDFGVMAGFVPLTNICKDFPCLNVHPGDLTIESQGKRLLVGLHTVPIEIAILNSFSVMRSSVILVQPYTGSGGEMDSGPILGISDEVKIDLCGFTFEQLKAIYQKRPSIRPTGGYQDELEKVAKVNQEKLKREGDWVVFPQVVVDFARGKFKYDESGALYFSDNLISYTKVKTVIYRADKTKIPIAI